MSESIFLRYQMKPLYYVILYRPRGSKTWTPFALDYNESPAGNYFVTQDRAIQIVRRLIKQKHRSYLPGKREWVLTEFATGAVMFNEEVK